MVAFPCLYPRGLLQEVSNARTVLEKRIGNLLTQVSEARVEGQQLREIVDAIFGWISEQSQQQLPWADILSRLERIEDKMATVLETISALQGVLDSIPPVLTKIAADEAAQAAAIKALQDQIAAGGNVTVAQLQPLLDRANAIKANVDAIDVSVPDAPPTP